MKRIFLYAAALAIFLTASVSLRAADTCAAKDSTSTEKIKKEKKKKKYKTNEKGEIIKTGITLGPLPVIAYDADKGFEYGAILNLYNFGDGSTYPHPKSSWYLEASAYTKGTQKYVVSYDDKYLIPGVRLSAAASVQIDKALEFFGFNGYQSIYDPDMPTGFYRCTKLAANFKSDFVGKIVGGLYWEAGYHFNYFKAGYFSTDAYQLETTLLELYNKWGIIPDDQLEGGFSSAVRAGLVYDTRDFEAAPSRGIWAEAQFVFAPKFLGTTHPYNKLNLMFRHYIPIWKDRLVFAYRLNYQGFLSDDVPWYIMPYLTVVGPLYDREAIGGYRTARGIMMNRVQGKHEGFYNAELRWKFIDFRVWRQNVTLALSGFCDGAYAFDGYDLENKTGYAPELYSKYIDLSSPDRLHVAAGAGFRIIINGNFIVAAEYAHSINRQDGKGAFYLNTGFLF